MLAPSRSTRAEDPIFQEHHRLITRLGLEEGKDVVFLGFVRDTQLLDLYQRAAVVVNAARYDNGTLCSIEGRYFGRPIVSSRYAAAEELIRRFDLPAHFFPVEDADGLADALVAALSEQPLTGAELAQFRARLEQPHFTHRHYAEQVYQLLVAFARQARERRAARN